MFDLTSLHNNEYARGSLLRPFCKLIDDPDPPDWDPDLNNLLKDCSPLGDRIKHDGNMRNYVKCVSWRVNCRTSLIVLLLCFIAVKVLKNSIFCINNFYMCWCVIIE